MLSRGYDLNLFGGLPRIRLIEPGRIARPDLLTLARAQIAGVETAYLGADGATWSVAPADVPIYWGSARGLRIQGQRTNLGANPRTPGGTGWTSGGITQATTSGPDGGVASASRLTEDTTTAIHYTSGSNVSFASGQSYVVSALARAGTCSTIQLYGLIGAFGAQAFANFTLSSAGSVGAVGSAVTASGILRTGDWYWVWFAAPAVATISVAGATVALTTTSSAARAPSYVGTSRYVDVAWVGTEQAPFSSTPILPPVASPAASTRGADLVTATLASLGIGGNGACTVLWSGVIPAVGPTGDLQPLFTIDDGTANNRWTPRDGGGGTTINLIRVNGGAATNTPGFAQTPGAPFRFGMTVDGAGRAAITLNGTGIAAGTGGPTSGLTTLRVGAGGGANMFGDVYYLDIIPRAISDATLQREVAAMPLA